MLRKVETLTMTREAAMKTKIDFPYANAYGHNKPATAWIDVIPTQTMLGYLMSIGDVVLALSIMIGICSLSLLSLYSALGAL